MLKKIFCMMLVSMLLVTCFAACNKGEEEPPLVSDTQSESDTTQADTTEPPAVTPDSDSGTEEEDNGNNGGENNGGTENDGTTTTPLNSSTPGIRLLGERRIASDSYIACDMLGSGIEFTLHNAGEALSIQVQTSAACRFEVYVDGVLKTPLTGGNYFEVSGNGMISLAGIGSGNRLIRVVRITEQSAATAQFTSLTYSGVLSATAPTSADMLLEFVGTAGVFTYANALAAEMDADISILMNSAYTVGADVNVSAIYGLASPERNQTQAHAFARKADIIVLDLSAAEAADAEDFTAAYRALLETVRAKNGADAKIICVYDDADSESATALKNLCKALGGQKEAGIYTCRKNSGSDGEMSAEEQATFMETLITVTGYAADGIITERLLDTETSGAGLDVSYNDFTVL